MRETTRKEVILYLRVKCVGLSYFVLVSLRISKGVFRSCPSAIHPRPCCHPHSPSFVSSLRKYKSSSLMCAAHTLLDAGDLPPEHCKPIRSLVEESDTPPTAAINCYALSHWIHVFVLPVWSTCRQSAVS